MLKFNAFIDKKEREGKQQLKLIEKMFAAHGIKVVDNLDDNDPYIYVYNPQKNTFFEGIRIYKIGKQIAFRVQKEEKTHPFGTAYSLPIEDMFTDLVSDHKPEEAGKRVIEAVLTEVKKFFEKSAIAEKEIREKEFDRNSFGKVVIRSSDFGMVDYSNLTYAK
jgi:hypothetical protein